MALQSVEAALKMASDGKGAVSERRVAAVMEQYTDRYPTWLRGYDISTYEEDRIERVDGWFLTDVGKIPLQIKSSYNYDKEKYEKLDIPVIVVKTYHTQGEIFRNLFDIVTVERDKRLAKEMVDGVG